MRVHSIVCNNLNTFFQSPLTLYFQMISFNLHKSSSKWQCVVLRNRKYGNSRRYLQCVLSLRMKSTPKWNGELLGVVCIEKDLFSDYYPLGPTHSHIVPLDLVQGFSSGFYIWFFSLHAIISLLPRDLIPTKHSLGTGHQAKLRETLMDFS